MKFRSSSCHPTRQVYGKGLCAYCWRKQRPPSACHPNRPRHVGELCRPCYRTKMAYGLAYCEIALGQDHCHVCGALPKQKKHAVDHDHKTRQVRGILCSSCNTGIGLFRDDPQLLRKAAFYIQHAPLGAGLNMGENVIVS